MTFSWCIATVVVFIVLVIGKVVTDIILPYLEAILSNRRYAIACCLGIPSVAFALMIGIYGFRFVTCEEQMAELNVPKNVVAIIPCPCGRN